MAPDQIAKSLRHALEAGDFETSAVLAGDYREAISRELRTVGSYEERAAIAGETIAFLQDQLHLARVLRAHLSSRLATACRTQSYTAEPTRENIWQLEA